MCIVWSVFAHFAQSTVWFFVPVREKTEWICRRHAERLDLDTIPAEHVSVYSSIAQTKSVVPVFAPMCIEQLIIFPPESKFPILILPIPDWSFAALRLQPDLNLNGPNGEQMWTLCSAVDLLMAYHVRDTDKAKETALCILSMKLDKRVEAKETYRKSLDLI